MYATVSAIMKSLFEVIKDLNAVCAVGVVVAAVLTVELLAPELYVTVFVSESGCSFIGAGAGRFGFCFWGKPRNQRQPAGVSPLRSS